MIARILTALCCAAVFSAPVRALDSASPTVPPVMQGSPLAATALDSTHVCVVGSFAGTRDFNPTVGGTLEKTSIGLNDAFVSNLQTGNLPIWTQTFGGTGEDFATSVAVSGGTVYVAGYFSSTDAGFGGAGPYQTTGAKDVFVLALDAATGLPIDAFGTHGVQIFGGSGDDLARGIAVLDSTVYVAGTFSSTDAGFGGVGTIAALGSQNTFVLALDAAAGIPVATFGSGGVQTFGGSGSDLCAAIAANSGTVYLAGQLSSPDAGFGGILGAFAPAGTADAFVLELDASSGQPITTFGNNGVRSFGGGGSASASALTLSANSNLYVAGTFSGGPAGFNLQGGAAATAVGQDAFVLALNATTAAPLATFGFGGMQVFGGTGDDTGNAIYCAASTLVLAGEVSSFDAGIGNLGTVASAGRTDAYFAALDAASGYGLYDVRTFGGSDYDYARNLCGSGSNVFMTGPFASANAGLDGTGKVNAANFGGYLLSFDAATGASLPQIISPLHAFGVSGSTFTYTLLALDAIPANSQASSLPAGLTFDPASGTLAGTLPVAGTYTITLKVSNQFGSDSGDLVLDVVNDAVAASNPPVIQGTARAVALDAAGNRYVVGSFTGTVDFNPGVGVDLKVSAGNADAFVTRFNVDGSYAWTQTFGGDDDDLGNAIVVDGSTVYVAGSFSSDTATLGATTVPLAGLWDAFVLALNSGTGAPAAGFGTGGVQTFGGSDFDEAFGVAALDETIFVTGYFGGSDAQVGASIASPQYSATGIATAFVLALNGASGDVVSGFGMQGVQFFGGSETNIARAIVATPAALYVAGDFDSLDAGIGSPGPIRSSGGSDLFVFALDPATGAPATALGGTVRTFGGSNDDYGFGLAVSGSTVFVDGEFWSANAGINGVGSAATRGGNDAFVAAFDAATGAAAAGFGTGGIQTFGGSGTDYARGLSLAGSKLYVSGSFSSAAAGIGSTSLSHALGGSDAFALALDAQTGTAVPDFGLNGVKTFGGSAADYGNGVTATTQDAFIVGRFASTDAGVNGVGTVSATGFGGFLLDMIDQKLVPKITWTPPADIAYGAALSNAQLNASASVPGTFVYTPNLGTVLNAGVNQLLAVIFTPADVEHYAAATASVAINVLPVAQTIEFTEIPEHVYKDGPFALTAAATSGLPVKFAVVSGPATVNGKTLTLTGAGKVTIEASQAGDANHSPAPPVDREFDVAKANQNILFERLPDHALNDPPFDLAAASDSGLLVVFSLVSGPASLDGNTLTLTGAGLVTVRALQPGDANYNPASDVEQTFGVGRIEQSIAFAALSDKTFGDPPIPLTAAADSGLPVSFTVDSGPGSLTGNSLAITGVGTIVVRASQAGDAAYKPAPDVTQSFVVAKAGQTITFDSLTNKIFGAAPINLDASASSKLSVVLELVSGPAILVGKTLTITGAGTVVVRASQAGNANFNAAPDVTQSFNVAKADQSVTFDSIPNKTFGDAPIDLEASASSLLSVTLVLVSGPANLVGNTLTMTGAGAIVVRASQVGNANFNPAPDVTQTFDVLKAQQTIDFAALDDRTYLDAPFDLSAIASSKLSVGFSVVSGPASLTNNTLTLIGAGTVTVRATQEGNENYAAAPPVEQTISVTKAEQSIVFAPLQRVTFGASPFDLSGTASSGLNVIFSIVSGPATISSDVLTVTGGGTVVVAASQPGGANYNAAPPVTQSFISAVPFTLSKLSGSWKLAIKGKDTCGLSGILVNLPPTAVFSNQTVSIDVAGAAVHFKTTIKNSAKTPQGMLQLKPKFTRIHGSNTPAFAGGNVPFTAKYSGDFASKWLAAGLGTAGINPAVLITVDVTFTGIVYTNSLAPSVSVKPGKSGSFKKARSI